MIMIIACVALAVLIVALGLGAYVLIVRTAPKPVSDPRIDTLAGTINQMVQQQAAIQGSLEGRLSQLTERVTDKLHEQGQAANSTIADLRERLAVIDAAQTKIADLSTQVVSLQDVLANKQARGAFGEVQLTDIVQSILAPGNYTFQASLSNGRRVDCLITLPHSEGTISIDAKFPLEAYRDMAGAKDETMRQLACREFASAIRSHVKAIAEKYIVPGETAAQAIMFLPAEAVYAELHANFQNLVDEAARLKVWIVSPTTLMATLTTIRAILRDSTMREQAHVIQAKIGELLKDVERLDDRVSKLQKHLEVATEDAKTIRISTDKIIRRIGAIEGIDLSQKLIEAQKLAEA